MKLVMDEKLKHRLIGLAVIISLAAIFAPAVMKKSSQHLDSSYSVNVKLPPKPIAPNVVLTDEKDMFKTIKIAKVEIEPVSEESQLTELVKAEPVQSDLTIANQQQIAAKVEPEVKSKLIQLSLNEAANNTAKKIIKVNATQPVNIPVTVALNKKPILNKSKAKEIKKIAKVNIKPFNKKMAKANIKPLNKRVLYAVQLASFSQLTNAQILVNRLRTKGYKANFSKVPSKQGSVYKVYVGYSPRKPEVLKLKTQLASAMQINGFVVNTGVS